LLSCGMRGKLVTIRFLGIVRTESIHRYRIITFGVCKALFAKQSDQVMRDIKTRLKKVCVGSSWRRTLVRAVILGAVVYGVCSTVFLPIRIQGDSMLPMYKTGDYGFMNTLVYRWGDPQRFDVVAVRMAGKRVMYLKRIIGLPGETVEIRDGIVRVNGEVLAEPNLQLRGHWDLKKQSLSGDQYFVVGDNRKVPIHRHKFGKVKRHRIVGRAWLLRIPSL